MDIAEILEIYGDYTFKFALLKKGGARGWLLKFMILHVGVVEQRQT